MSASYMIGILILAALVVAVIARYRIWKRECAFAQRIRDEPISGRQQLRSAARTEAWKQIGGAPIDRKTRRQAARDVSKAALTKPTIKERKR